jgi:hypothetical protein
MLQLTLKRIDVPAGFVEACHEIQELYAEVPAPSQHSHDSNSNSSSPDNPGTYTPLDQMSVEQPTGTQAGASNDATDHDEVPRQTLNTKLQRRMKPHKFEQAFVAFLRATSGQQTFSNLGVATGIHKDDPLASRPICAELPNQGVCSWNVPAAEMIKAHRNQCQSLVFNMTAA